MTYELSLLTVLFAPTKEFIFSLNALEVKISPNRKATCDLNDF